MDIAKGYVRRNHEVEAVQVSYEQFHEIAKWCEGVVGTTRDGESVGILYIRVPIVRRAGANKTNRAYVSDWILRDGDGFKIYSNKSFTASFSPVVPDPKKFEAVLKLVKFAMLEQDAATYHGHSGDKTREVANAVALKIMEVSR